MKDPLFLSRTFKRQLSVESSLDERPTIDMIDLMSRMTRLADRPLDPIGKAVQDAESAACVIYVRPTERSESVQWTGSGFLLPDGIVVTANHVVEPNGPESEVVSVEVSFDGSKSYPAEVLGEDRSVDVAILRIDPRVPVRPAKLSDEVPTFGEIIATIGSPEGWANIVTVGRVSAMGMTPAAPPDPSWRDMMFIDADILEGSSGSMVIDVMGRVVGSVMGIIGRHAADVGSGQNAVVTVDKIKRVLDVVFSGG